MNAPLPLSAVCLLLTPPVTSSCQGSAFFPVRAPNLALSPSYLAAPLLLLAGRLGGEHFGGEWAKRRTNKVFVRPRRGTRDGQGGGSVAGADRVRRGPEGGRSAKKKIKLPCWWRCQGIVNTLQKLDTPEDTGA